MGIYAHTKIVDRHWNGDGTQSWVEVEETPGLIRRRRVTAEKWTEERTDCFCCSCSELGSMDPHCRNHGFDGQRPCEVHKMPGYAGMAGNMPDSVQQEVARWRG